MLMPNIGALLKQEIVRLSRREVRAQTQTTKKASAQYRHDIAALKRDVETLKRQISAFQRQALESPASNGDSTTRKVRFAVKGLRSQRSRLRLSAEDYGKLVGVSAQSVYNWEKGHAKPRVEQVKKVVALRGLRKRDAEARLKKIRMKDAKRSRQR